MKNTTIKAFCLMLISTMTLLVQAQPKNYHLLSKAEKEQKSLELIDQAEYMVEGERVDAECYYGEDGKTIYTKITFQVDNWYKGKGKDIIYIVVKGGVIGTDRQTSMHGSRPYTGKLRKSFLLLNKRNKDEYEFLVKHSSASGRYSHSRKDDFYIKAFCELKFDSKEAFHSFITRANKVKLPDKKKDVGLEEAKNNPSIVINSISPTTMLAAGVGQTITITGSGFMLDAFPEAGEVLFINADDPNEGHLLGLDDHYIESWSNTTIVVTVPSYVTESLEEDILTAGSGTIIVRRFWDNEEEESTQNIDIEYSLLNEPFGTNSSIISQMYLGREHCLNGKVFTLHENFKPGDILDAQQSVDAIQAIEDALEAWSNELGITLELERKQGGDYQYFTGQVVNDVGTSNFGLASRNVIHFVDVLDDALAAMSRSVAWQDCPLPDDECVMGPWNFRNNIAVLKIPDTAERTWEYDRTENINYSEKYDFYAVMLHEIGHALGLGHDIDLMNGELNLMHYAEPNVNQNFAPDDRVSLTNFGERAKEGASRIVQDSKDFEWTLESQVMYGLESLSENNSTVLETPRIQIWSSFPFFIGLRPSPYQSSYQYHWLPANSVANFVGPPRCGTLDYYVRTKNAGCTVSSLYSLPKTFGIYACEGPYPEDRGNQELIIYPNPTTGELQVEFEGVEQKNTDRRDIQIGIYDNLGRIQHQHMVSDTTHRQTTIDISALPAGTYWVVWFADGEVVDTQQIQKK